jgi:hypothetical protein
MITLTRAFDFLSRRVTGEPFWKWCAEMPHPSKGRVPRQIVRNPDAVYFPTCISRIMGALPGEAGNVTVMDALLSVAQGAGVRLFVPHDVQGHCSGVPFSSKASIVRTTPQQTRQLRSSSCGRKKVKCPSFLTPAHARTD